MSLLRHLRRKDRPPPPKALALEIPLLADQTGPDAARVFDHLRTRWPDLPVPGAPRARDGATAFDIPGGFAGFVHVPLPYPAHEIAAAARLAWHWPRALQEIDNHQSHVLASASSTSLTGVQLRLMLTKLVASILATTNSVGVYVGDATLVRSATDYLTDAAAATLDALPLMSWVGFHPMVEKERTSAYTTGLGWFGLLELEVHRSSLVAHEVLGTLAELAQYELRTGHVVGDGDTFGATPADRTRVRYRRSEFFPDSETAVVDLP